MLAHIACRILNSRRVRSKVSQLYVLIRTVSSLKLAACCPTDLTASKIGAEPRLMSIAF
jgi:hypothetical protein